MKYEYKHYVIYQITNLLNGMIYIGQHSTNNIDDGYMGSGVYLKQDIQKYGIDNFKKTILFECSSQEDLDLKERELVNEEFVNRDDTYNLVVGGGFKLTHGQAIKSGRLGQIIYRKKFETDDTYRNNILNKLSQSSKRLWEEHPEKFSSFRCDWTGKHHTEETKQKMRDIGKLHIGERNGAFGNIWIHNDLVRVSTTVKRDQLIYYFEQGWELGRVVNWDNHFKKLDRRNTHIKLMRKRKQQREAQTITRNILPSMDKQIDYYSSILPTFLKYRWRQFVEITGYGYSSQNFYQQVKLYLKLDRPTLKKMKKEIRNNK